MPPKFTRSAIERAVNRPTVLMVGAGDPMDAALKIALDRHGLFVEAVGLENLRRSVHLAAPDLILLLGDAAAQGGVAALTVLAEDASTAAVPVVLLAQDARLESRMHAFRHGAMAVVPRSASADAIARRVAQLSKELSEHFEEKTGEIGEATFDELVELVKKELRSGILSVHTPGHKGGPMRVVLGAGRPVAAAVQEFVARLKPHVQQADPMYYQFHTSAGGPVELLEADAPETGDVSAYERLRVLLVDDDPARADTLAQELRNRGALVFVTDTKGQGLHRAVGLDPQVAIIDAAGLEGQGFEVVRAIRKDVRLRWASILVAPWEEIWPKGAPSPDMERLAARIEPLLSPEQDLRERAESEAPFDIRLESTGPSRLMRILTQNGATLHLTVRNPKAVVHIDLAENLIVGAVAKPSEGPQVGGPAALATLLSLGSGRVRVERRANPSVANVMAPLDEALSAASQEDSAVRPSSAPPRHPVPSPPRPDVPRPDVPKPDVPRAGAASPAIPGPPPPPRSPDESVSGPLLRPTPPASSSDAPARPLAKGDLRWDATQSAEAFVPLEDDDEAPEQARTKIKDLSKLAEAGEVILDDGSTAPPPPVGPVAANERLRQRTKRKATLVMGAPVLSQENQEKSPSEPPPSSSGMPTVPAPPPSEQLEASAKRPARLKSTMLGMQAPAIPSPTPPPTQPVEELAPDTDPASAPAGDADSATASTTA
ncbi:MAG TPA: hypothetical protein DEF51_44680, partial [Myxococcales bacterium]|nr:hypothetical protein [Myxococcales bacterium]